MKPARSFFRAPTLTAALAVMLVCCAEETPPRDEIPAIKDRISELVRFYRGDFDRGLDSLLAPTFRAEMGRRGLWQAIEVDGEPWPLTGSTRREFFYTRNHGEAELSFVYGSPNGQKDSLSPVKITLSKSDGLWRIEDVQPVEPIGL